MIRSMVSWFKITALEGRRHWKKVWTTGRRLWGTLSTGLLDSWIPAMVKIASPPTPGPWCHQPHGERSNVGQFLSSIWCCQQAQTSLGSCFGASKGLKLRVSQYCPWANYLSNYLKEFTLLDGHVFETNASANEARIVQNLWSSSAALAGLVILLNLCESKVVELCCAHTSVEGCKYPNPSMINVIEDQTAVPRAQTSVPIFPSMA